MIKSMTGFGRCEIAEGTRKVTVELKSVNHRYLDVNIKMPKKLSFFESSIRNELKKYAQRGKIDMFITYESNIIRILQQNILDILMKCQRNSDWIMIFVYLLCRDTRRYFPWKSRWLMKTRYGRYWQRQ